MIHLHNQSAAVLLTVIVLTMVLSVIVISIMSITVGQVKSSQSVIDELKADYLAQAYFLKYHQEMTTLGTNSLGTIPDSILDNKSFSVSSASSDTGPNDTTELTMTVSY